MIKILNLFLLLQTISGEMIPQTLIQDTATDLEFPVTGEYEDDNKPSESVVLINQSLVLLLQKSPLTVLLLFLRTVVT